MPGLWRTPLTWSIGLVTDTMMNQHIRDQLSALKNDHMLCCGRLTLTSGVPVTTADVTAATTVYFTPFRGNLIGLHDGGHWQVVAFSERSLSLGSDAANTNYDLFGYYNSGALALERTAWTNPTTRSVALTVLDGVLVKSSDLTRRYLGTYRTSNAVGQTEDTAQRRYVWNYYQRLPRPVRVTPTTDSWTYTTPTFRDANGDASNSIAVLIGVAEVTVDLRLVVSASNSTGTAGLAVAIGEDVTNAAASGSLMVNVISPTAGSVVFLTASLVKSPAVGLHSYFWLEFSTAAGTTTWYGDFGSPATLQSGITGTIEG
jgi:hypothetical protein